MKVVYRIGPLSHRRVVSGSGTGPAQDTTVAAGGTADITITVDTGIKRPAESMGIVSISGLPSGVYIADITVDAANKTVTLTLANPGSSDVTVSANSITVTAIAVN